MPTTAGQPPGSGANFAALKGKLAARGAHNPGALAAWIGRRKYGRKAFGAMSHHHAHEGPGGILLAGWSESDHHHSHEHTHSDGTTHTHEHSHSHEGHPHDSAIMHGGPGSASGTGLEAGSSLLRTPQPAALQSKAGFSTGHGLNVRGASGRGLMASWQTRGLAARGLQYANGGPAVELAPPMAVTSPWDVLVSRGDSGVVVIRHRRGGQEMGQLRHADDGSWIPVINGQELAGRTHQRAALADVIGSNNRLASTPLHRPGAPIQPAPTQTPLMAQYGIPAVRALATPVNGAGDGPRETESSGLSPRGQSIYKKLRGRNFPHERAMAFARRAQNFGGKAA